MVDEFFRFVIVSGWVIIVRIILMPIFVEIFDFHPWTSAMLINIIKAFFLIIIPKNPIVKSIAASVRYQSVVTSSITISFLCIIS